jgi:hypothetical protein
VDEEHFQAHVFEPALACSECGRTWEDPSERWRVNFNDADQAVSYCPECARRTLDD